MHCKVTKDRGFWLGTAIAMQSLMVAGLIDHRMSYQEYTPVYDDYQWREWLSEKVMMMNSDEMLGASRRVKIKPERALVMQCGGVAA